MSASESREEVIKVEATAKATLSTAKAASEGVASSAKWITTSRVTVGVEAGGTKLVKLFLLLGVGQDFVCGLDIGESFLCRVVFVGIGMVFLG